MSRTTKAESVIAGSDCQKCFFSAASFMIPLVPASCFVSEYTVREVLLALKVSDDGRTRRVKQMDSLGPSKPWCSRAFVTHAVNQFSFDSLVPPSRLNLDLDDTPHHDFYSCVN